MVQVSSPAKIPLIQVRQVEKTAGAAKIAAPTYKEASAQEIKNAADDLLKQAQNEAAAKLQAGEAEAEVKLAEAGKMAAARLAEAESEARNILEKAQRQGQQEGLAFYQRQTQEAAQEFKRLLSEIAQAREAYFNSFEGEMVDLALSVAEKIVLYAINKDDAAFKLMIENALKHMRREDKIFLHISEQQYKDFFNAECASFELGGETVTVAVINDPLLENGGLILESDEEIVNAGAASQLKYISLAFGRPRGNY